MADLAHMSRTSFVNLFGKIVGMPPAAYLAEWRMGLAEAMLKEGRPVKEAALAIGYGNQPAFTRAFIARHGMSPTEWLKRGHEASAGRIAQAG
jgi:AraC-like DNA-binding protein